MSYQSTIRGRFLTVYRSAFSINEIVRPPEGRSFRRVTQWRKGCVDECWRILYVQAKP